MAFSGLLAASVAFLVVWSLFCLYLCRSMLRFWQTRESNIIKSRRPLLTLVFCGLVLIRSIIIQPMSLFALVNDDINNSFAFYTLTTQNIVTDCIGILMTNLWIARIWMLFYDFRFSQANWNALWKKHIQPDTITRNFWLNHRKNLGNINWVTQLLIVLTLPLAFVFIGIPLIYRQHIGGSSIVSHLELHNFLVFIFFLPLIIFCIVLATLVVPVQDALYIRDELFRSIIVMIIAATVIFSLFISQNSHSDAWFNFLWYSIVNTALLTLAYVMTGWVLYRNSLIEATVDNLSRQQSVWQRAINASHSVPIVVESNRDESSTATRSGGGAIAALRKQRSGSKNKDNPNGNKNSSVSNPLYQKRVALRSVLRVREGFEAFCHYLLQELSVENMLFLVEVAQFKATLKRKLYAQADASEDIAQQLQAVSDLQTRGKRTRFHRRVPTLLNEDFVLELDWLPLSIEASNLSPYRHGMYIYQKYVCELTKFSINISYENKMNVKTFFNPDSLNANEENYKSLFTVFDSAWNEVWGLLESDSFKRFMLTPAYAKLYEILFRRGQLDDAFDDDQDHDNPFDTSTVDDVQIEYRRQKVDVSTVQTMRTQQRHSHHRNRSGSMSKSRERSRSYKEDRESSEVAFHRRSRQSESHADNTHTSGESPNQRRITDVSVSMPSYKPFQGRTNSSSDVTMGRPSELELRRPVSRDSGKSDMTSTVTVTTTATGVVSSRDENLTPMSPQSPARLAIKMAHATNHTEMMEIIDDNNSAE